jgi:hypothetical protein
MRYPKIEGLIRRRLLVNFLVDPKFVRRLLPAPFRPQVIGGAAQAGICLIRLERMRPMGLPAAIGFSSENAAHRIAVEWETSGCLHSGVYIPRRDSDSRITRIAGGRVFPGKHHAAHFEVRDHGGEIAFTMESCDAHTNVELRARPAAAMPSTSTFANLAAASSYYERGSLGYSPAGDHLDGIRLVTRTWKLQPLEVEYVRSSFFGDVTRFPPGSVEFDSALVMRDIESAWYPVPRLRLAA